MRSVSLLISVFVFASGFTTHTGQESHGGEPLVLEFMLQAERVIAELPSVTGLEGKITSSDILRMRKELDRTRVAIVKSPLYVNGEQVSVRNTSLDSDSVAHMVEIYQPAMYNWLRHGGKFRHLVFHELLWLIGKDDSNYKISRKVHFVGEEIPNSGLIKDICRGT